MIYHLALAKWKPEVRDTDVAALLQMIISLKHSIPALRTISCGPNFSKWNLGYTHAVVATFDDREGLDAYRAHPAHQKVATLWDQYELEGIGIDFDADPLPTNSQS